MIRRRPIESQAEGEDNDIRVHVPSAEDGSTEFNVQVLTEAEFIELTGVPAGALPERVIVSANSIAPPAPVNLEGGTEKGAAGLSAVRTRLPTAMPVNATGVAFTDVSFAHLSQFSNAKGQLTQRGFRYSLPKALLKGYGKSALSSGVPGGYFNDFLFTLSPNQTVVYRVQSESIATSLARQLKSTNYQVQYKFPPCGSNCISVPTARIEAALGTKMELVTRDALIDVTREGRSPKGVSPEYAGKASQVREYLNQPNEYFEERGLTRQRVSNFTPAARVGVSFIRVGGAIFLIYGINETRKRLQKYHGTPQFNQVVREEAGGWAGGLIGSAVGSAIGGAVACSPTGPVTLLCAAGGFVGGLLFGIGGAMLGSKLAGGPDNSADDGSNCPSCHDKQRQWVNDATRVELDPMLSSPVMIDSLPSFRPDEIQVQFDTISQEQLIEWISGIDSDEDSQESSE